MANTSSLAQADLIPQLMRLFHAAGLLSEADWDSYGESHEPHKPILDVLTQPVSLESFKDLFNAEITFKTGRSRKSNGESALHRELSTNTLTNNPELEKVLGNFQCPIPALLAPLQRDGLLDADLLRQLERLSRTDYTSLIGPQAVQSDMIHHWLSSLHSRAMQESALYLALFLARENGLLPQPDFVKLLDGLPGGDLPALRARIATDFGLTSARLLAEIENGMQVQRLRLENFELDPQLIARFPENLIRRQTFLPMGRTAHFLAIATADPFDISQAAFLRWVTGLWPEPAFASARELIDTINEYFAGERETTPRPAESAPPELPTAAPSAPRASAPGLAPAVSQASDSSARGDLVPGEAAAAVATRKPRTAAPASGKPVAVETRNDVRRRFDGEMITDNVSAVQLVSSLIENAIELRTTDIHIEPVRSGLVVRFRIDGDLHRILAVPASLAQPVISRIKVLAEMDVTERRRPQDGHFELKLENHNFDFRISTLPAILGEKLVIRILDTAQVKTGLEELGLLPKQRQMVDWMLARQHGMILVTGPTGSGKTSTLYAALNKLNSESRNLITIEDPVEYQLAGVTQVQVNTDIGLTFSEGLRSVLRQDPDVIMVGEIRDTDTARNAIRAATTGHLVLSTLHTNSALGTVDALVQMGAAPFILSHSILGIIAQRLVRRLCPHCRKGVALKPDVMEQLGLRGEVPKKRVYKPGGCDECLGSGYFGRTGVFEVIRINEPLRAMLSTHQRQEVLEQACREQEMLSIQQAGAEKVLAGETSAEEIIRKIMMDI